MNYTKLIKEKALNYTLEEIVIVNRLLDYLLEQDSLSRDLIEGLRAEGELFEQAIFEQMESQATP